MVTKKATTVTNETKVVCPVCGAEFDVLAQHEHKVKNATVLGADSGMGTIYLPVSKRGEALKAAGIDTSKYFAIPKQDGTDQLMTYDANGVPVAVDAADPIIQQILGNQDEAEDDDDSHNPAVLPADIGVGDHGDRQPDQQKQQRDQQRHCVQIPDHVTSSPSLAGSQRISFLTLV